MAVTPLDLLNPLEEMYMKDLASTSCLELPCPLVVSFL